MVMRDVTEPSKWVCRLTTFFDGSYSDTGSGVLVHIPDSAKFCIFTAGHNIVTVDPKPPKKAVLWAKTIEVNFPGGLKFTVTREECRVSRVYGENPSSGSGEDSSLLDYGLIFTDKRKHLDANPELPDPGGCGFDILVPRMDIVNTNIAVHGYPKGRQDQEMNSSRVHNVDKYAIYYNLDTMGGVSGGPALVSKKGLHTVIGIHNYDNRATRLTPAVMFEILSWIEDYSLQRVFRMFPEKEPGRYLQATLGTAPRLTVRPGIAYLNCVLAASPQTGSGQHSLHLLLPPSAAPHRNEPLQFLTLPNNQTQPTFCREKPDIRGPILIDIVKETTFSSIYWPGDKSVDRQYLKIQPCKRGKHCDFGCITQDDDVVTAKRGPATLSISPYQPSQTNHEAQAKDTAHLPPLYAAVLNRDKDDVVKHLKEGADPDIVCSCGTTPLFKAAENGDFDIVKALMESGAGIDTCNRDNESPDLLAQRNGHERVGRWLNSSRGKRVEKLLVAAKEGSIEEISGLLSLGVPANARRMSDDTEFFGSCALEVAAQFGHPDAVLYLVRDAKVNTTEVDPRGWTALHKGAENGNPTVVIHLLRYGALVNSRDEDKMTPLHRAAQLGHVGAISALCADEEIEIDPTERMGATPLMLAAENGHIDAVRTLLERGAKATAVDCNGYTARDLAERRGRGSVCRLLDELRRGIP